MFIEIELVEIGSLLLNATQATVLRVVPVTGNKFALSLAIMPGKEVFVKQGGVDYYDTRAAAQVAADLLKAELDAASGGGGEQGIPGTAATVSVGTTTTGAAGTNASVTQTGTAQARTFNFVIPKGDKGDKGDDGTNATISGATATVNNAVGTPGVTVTPGGTSSNRSFAFAFTNLKGDKGDKGDDGGALVAGDNITIDENTNVISASGKGFHRVRIFNSDDKLITTQIIYDGEKLMQPISDGILYYYNTDDLFDYNDNITEDIDLAQMINGN